ncbi:MAG: ATP-dependent zinc metalloprotease FtsH [Chloroflexi bacterium]|nr:ATP-dependent zinc metalloprotease FtsH [Chloroflexota bacterium]MCH9037911.1 ATP-dependent zinc metalloprotease FtsH [Chloroflexota bacterium]MCI0791035.1 ATP-dependent zinc metalloprotease FtsH [Chloroflexota bacterium]MCI0795293.1 ATP-dependent zinc metalloprotease FtsH [Chloroflexota bacterium]MCI0868544.1 ATP-dependent zinc metalloprotease FtsH [Chloroflexota bacterium]
MNSRLMRNGIIYLLIVVAVLAIFFTLFSNPLGGSQQIPISEVIIMTARGDVDRIEVRGSNLDIFTTSGENFTSRKEDGASMVEILEEAGIDPLASDVQVAVKGASGLGGLFGLLINFLPLIFFGAVLLFMMRQAQGNSNQTFSFGRSRARMFVGNSPSVSFSDVAGVEEAKEELEEVVEFLKFPERFTSLGAKIPKGILLVGPPGTGKTLLARAVAGEAEVPFFSISGSEFVEMFVGVGASRVRDLFDQAKRNSPCIIFVDEIDAVGRRRGAGLGGGHDEREQTLNQILVEMDGFDVSTNVIVLAATNRVDILDPALLRPGRFDRRVTLDNPDVRGREQILKVHSKGKPLADDVDLEKVAKQTMGFSGADLANLVNESAILAARRKKTVITFDEFAESIDRVVAGPARKSKVVTEREKRITAFHEAGHALVAFVLPNADMPFKVTIVARGHSAGHTRYLPEEDRHLWTTAQFEDTMAAAMGGRVAEQLTFDDITTGASDDLEQATNIARSMVTRYGMSEKLGPRTFGKREEMVFLGREITEQRDYSDKVAQDIDEEVHTLVESAYDAATKVLTDHSARLAALANRLLTIETVESDEIRQILGADDGPGPDAPQTATSPSPA